MRRIGFQPHRTAQGFLAQAHKFQAAIASNTITAPAKTVPQMQQIVRPSAPSPRMRLATRSRISLADLLVKVIAAIRLAG